MNFLTANTYLVKSMKNLCFIAILLLSISSLGAEYTAGMRTFSGSNFIVGQVGANPFVGAPPLVSIPYILNFKDANVAFGAELFGEVGITRMIYIEPHIGYLYQSKQVTVPGIETNINGKTSFSDDITVSQRLYNMVFGLSVKGKTPD